MWFLLGVIWLALIAGIVWWYQKKQREREAAQEKRFAEMFGAELSPTKPALASVMPSLTEAAVAYARKPRLLTQRHALLYYILRTGLPDHEIFADHALVDFIEVSGTNREPALRQLTTQRADFIICNKQMEVIAAIMLNNAGISAAAKEALQATQVRLIYVNPDALPKHTQVRELIYG